MADKHLTEAGWKVFAKGKKLDDGDLIKALQVLDKSEKKPAEDQLKAAQALDKASTGLRKQAKGDKDLAGYLDELDKTLGKKIKDLERQAKEEAEASESEGEDEESPALLTSKMAPLVKALRKGDVTMPVLIATAGKDTKVLIQRRSIAPTRKKVLAEALGVSGGIKYLTGECLLEDNQLTFVMQTQAAGLAKRIRAALLEQVEMRVKVRVRGEGGEIDEDLEDEGGAGAAPGPTAAQTAAQGADIPAPPSAEAMEWARRVIAVRERIRRAEAAAHPALGKLGPLMQFAQGKADAGDHVAAIKGLEAVEKLLEAPAPASTGGVDPATAFNARLAALMPKVKEAIAGGTRAGQDAKLKVSEAGVAARKKEFEPANQLLDEVEQLLQGLQPPAGGSTTAEEKKGPAPNVAFTQSRLAWDATRKKVQQELRKLEAAILETCKEESNLQEIAEGTKDIYSVLEVLDERLIDKLDEALNAADPQERSRLHGEAKGIVDEYSSFVANDEFIQALDDNGFIPLAVFSTLTTQLGAIRQRLNALA